MVLLQKKPAGFGAYQARACGLCSVGPALSPGLRARACSSSRLKTFRHRAVLWPELRSGSCENWLGPPEPLIFFELLSSQVDPFVSRALSNKSKSSRAWPIFGPRQYRVFGLFTASFISGRIGYRFQLFVLLVISDSDSGLSKNRKGLQMTNRLTRWVLRKIGKLAIAAADASIASRKLELLWLHLAESRQEH